MIDIDSNRKKLYDAAVNLIFNLHVQKRVLSKEEMHCLLSILDLIFIAKDDYGLVSLLRDWEASEPDVELQEIVKATLVKMDFSDLESQQINIDTIRDLLRYNKKLRES
jgi:hypothetical protein